jgi:hypothetical protein
VTEAEQLARQIRESIAENADRPIILAKAASGGPRLKELSPALAAAVRLELVRAVLGAPAKVAVNVLDAFDWTLPRGWSISADEPCAYSGDFPAGPSVRVAWAVATRAAGVTDPDELERLRSEVADLLTDHPEHLAWSVEQVDAVAVATGAGSSSGASARVR